MLYIMSHTVGVLYVHRLCSYIDKESLLLLLQDSGTDRILATRIQVLPAGSVRFDTVTSQVYEGVVAEELTSKPDKTALENPFRLLCLTLVRCTVHQVVGDTGLRTHSRGDCLALLLGSVHTRGLSFG